MEQLPGRRFSPQYNGDSPSCFCDGYNRALPGIHRPGMLEAKPAKEQGSVAEWFKALVLKTSDGQPSVSSNLTASAKMREGRNAAFVV